MWKRCTCFVLLSGLILTSPAPAADPSLVGWWKLDETSGTTAADSSGVGNHGTLNGSPPWVAAGQIHGALQLNGTTQYVECGNSASLNLATQVSLAAWIKPSALANGQHQVFVCKGDHSYALKHNSGNYVEFNVYNGAWYTARNTSIDASWNGVWHEWHEDKPQDFTVTGLCASPFWAASIACEAWAFV